VIGLHVSYLHRMRLSELVEHLLKGPSRIALVELSQQRVVEPLLSLMLPIDERPLDHVPLHFKDNFEHL